jgi:hypothetical protein
MSGLLAVRFTRVLLYYNKSIDLGHEKVKLSLVRKLKKVTLSLQTVEAQRVVRR